MLQPQNLFWCFKHVFIKKKLLHPQPKILQCQQAVCLPITSTTNKLPITIQKEFKLDFYPNCLEQLTENYPITELCEIVTHKKKLHVV